MISRYLLVVTPKSLVFLITIADAGQYHIFESVTGIKHLKEGKTKVYTTIEFTILRLKPSESKTLIFQICCLFFEYVYFQLAIKIDYFKNHNYSSQGYFINISPEGSPTYTVLYKSPRTYSGRSHIESFVNSG